MYLTFRIWVFQICEIDLADFLSAAELVSQPALQKTKGKLDLRTDNDMLLMIELSIRRGISYLFIDMPKLIILKDYNENRESSYLQYWHDIINNKYNKQFTWMGNMTKGTCRWFCVG